MACDCLSIAPDWFGTQATVFSVTDSIPATFLNSAAYRLTDPSPDMVERAWRLKRYGGTARKRYDHRLERKVAHVGSYRRAETAGSNRATSDPVNLTVISANMLAG
jgi:hypothetical protein